MNIELLQASKDKIPDRIDATLSLFSPAPVKKKKQGKINVKNHDESKSAQSLAINHKGGYIAVGYGSGTVAVFDLTSRTLCALYKSCPAEGESDSSENVGVSHISWSRNSTCILTGAIGSRTVQLIDTTHPFGPEECVMFGIEKKDDKEKDEDEVGRSISTDSVMEKKEEWNHPFIVGDKLRHHNMPRNIPTLQVKLSPQSIVIKNSKSTASRTHEACQYATVLRFPRVTFKMPQRVGKSLQIHPNDTCAGLSVLMDGSLIAFALPSNVWSDLENESPNVKIMALHKDEEQKVSCACFDIFGERIFAGTSSGELMGFEIGDLFDQLLDVSVDDTFPTVKPSFAIQIPGRATVETVSVSKNGKDILLNSVDGAIRTYSTEACWATPEMLDRPSRVFQDKTSVDKFSACTFSGDGRYILGAYSGEPDKSSKLYIWNTKTGELVDQLSGTTEAMNDVAWYPTRSMLAVASSDGLVDLWGPRVNWTAFAPSFEALTENIEYVECEDEHDFVSIEKMKSNHGIKSEDEAEVVDVLNVTPIPGFASLSQTGEDFFFRTKVRRVSTMNTIWKEN